MTRSSPSSLEFRAVTAFVWSYGSFLSNRVVTFVATLILARLLSPEDFGLVAFALAIIAYLDSVTDLGVGAALVYRPDGKEPRIASTAFWVAVAGGIILTVGAWLVAPVLNRFGPNPSAGLIFAVLGLQFFMSGLSSTQAYLFRHSLEYRKVVVPEVLGGLVKGGISVALAFGGLGVWSLVAGQLAGTAVRSTGYWIASSWRPRFTIARDELRPLLGFGVGVSAVSVVGTGITNSDYLIVGAMNGATALGFYFIAFRVPELVIMPLFRVAQNVLFPYYARLRDPGDDAAGGEEKDLVGGYLRTLHLGALISFPLGFGMAALAEPIILTLFGEKWQRSASPMALIAVWASFAALTGMPGSIFKATGRSGLMVKTAILQLVLVVPSVWFATRYGITGVAAGQVAVKIAYFLILAVIVGRVLSTPFLPMVWQVVPGLVVAAPVGFALYGLAQILPAAAAIAIGVPVGCALYLALVRAILPNHFKELVRRVPSLGKGQTPTGKAGAAKETGALDLSAE